MKYHNYKGEKSGKDKKERELASIVGGKVEIRIIHGGNKTWPAVSGK